MKKYLFLILLILNISCSNSHIKLATGLEGKPLPNIDLTLSDSITHFNTSNILFGKNIVIICFSPFCPYCRAEISGIIKNIEALKEIDIYLVTVYPISDMKKFYDSYHLNKYSNIIVAQDQKNNLLTYFKATGIPYTAVYDKQKRLKETLYGLFNTSILDEILSK